MNGSMNQKTAKYLVKFYLKTQTVDGLLDCLFFKLRRPLKTCRYPGKRLVNQ